MKILGFVLLVIGWILALAALPLLPGARARAGFVLAGIGVEVLGLVLVIRAHLFLRSPGR